MSINTARCVVCKNPDLRRLIELGWNAKMSIPDLVHAFGGVPSHTVIHRHLKEHAEGAYSRRIEVEDARPIRERVLAIQRSQIEAIERQMTDAQRRADEWNEYHRDHEKDGSCGECEHSGFQVRDPAHYFNILSKDMQAAVSSILKAQGLTDKREAKTSPVVDMFRLMLGASGGLAPAGLIEAGDTIEGDAVEVPVD